MKESILHTKALDFAAEIMIFYEEFAQLKKDTTVAKQLLRSATSVGANLNEATFGNSKADFINKLHISLKEANESVYWLTLLQRVYKDIEKLPKLLKDANEIKAMLVASLNTAKGN
ncbi:MAG: four helix bundle protein [Firmicutes bacterium]|nr:four helix bundle protein [Bacillota bacterium]